MIVLKQPKKMSSFHYFRRYQALPDVLIGSIGDVQSHRDDSLVFIEAEKDIRHVSDTIACLITTQELASQVRHSNVVVVDHVKWAMQQVLTQIAAEIAEDNCNAPIATVAQGALVDSTAHIERGSRIEKGVTIGRNVCIGHHCVIEQGVRIADNVVIGDNVHIGADSVIKPNAVIGSRGFGFVWYQNQWHQIPHLAGVKLGQKCHIGASTCIDAGVIRPTLLENNVAVDNLCHIAHNVIVGNHTVIAGCFGIAGSTQIGNHCQIGGGVKIAGHLLIDDRVIIQGGSTVTQSLKNTGVFSNVFPISEVTQWRARLRQFIRLGRNQKKRS